MLVVVALVTLSTLASLSDRVHAAGGIAEMKALTGDAPYLGVGNLEQAPEYFGDAAYRQYYQNPSYGFAPNSPWSNYAINTRNTYYGGGAGGYPRTGFYQGAHGGVVAGGGGGGDNSPIVGGNGPPGISAGVGTGGSTFYQGRGNEFVNKH